MWYFKTYSCIIWSEIAIRKGSFSKVPHVDCSTLQASRPNQSFTPDTQRTVSQHIQSNIFAQSLHHRNATSQPSFTILNHALPCFAHFSWQGHTHVRTWLARYQHLISKHVAYSALHVHAWMMMIIMRTTTTTTTAGWASCCVGGLQRRPLAEVYGGELHCEMKQLDVESGCWVDR